MIPAVLRARRSEEVKVLDVQSGSGQLPNAVMALNTTGTVLFLNALEVGSTFCNRVGRRVQWRSIRVMATLGTLAAARTSPLDIGRLILIYDRQPNGALPAMATILQATDQTTTNFTNAIVGLNMNQRERFAVLMDVRIALPIATGTATLNDPTALIPSEWPSIHSAKGCHSSLIIDEFRKTKNLISHYQADSAPGVIGDISTGAFYLVSLAQNNAAGADVWQIGTYSVRMKFTDA